MTRNNQILASLSYFSIVLLGVIFPLIVYFAIEDREVKRHAKRALFSQLLPFIMGVILFLIMAIFALSETVVSALPILLLVGFAATGIVSLIVLIWNIYQGVLLLKD